METWLPTGAPPAAGIPPRPWGLPAILLGLALPLLLWGVSLGITISQGPVEDLTDGEVAMGVVVTIVLDLALIGLAAGLSIWRYQLSWEDLGLRPFDPHLWWLPVTAAAAALTALILYSTVLISLGAQEAAPQQKDLEPLFQSRAILPLTGVAVLLMAPLAEEIFFRGFMFAGLLRPFGLNVAMAASGLVFGVFHITGPDTLGVIVPFSLIGMLFAWLYYRTGSLWPNIVAHFLFNVVGFVAGAAGG